MAIQTIRTTTTTPVVETAPLPNRSRPLYRGTQAVWYILDVIEVLLALRFVLKLFGANPYAGFTNFIYSVSGIFTTPFTNVFRSARVSGSVFEWTTLLAMVFYWLLAWAIVRLFVINKPVSQAEATTKLNKQDVVD